MQSTSCAETGVLPPPPVFLTRGGNSIRAHRPLGRRHHHFDDANIVDLRYVDSGKGCGSCVMGHSCCSTATEDLRVGARRGFSQRNNQPTKVLDFLFIGGVSDATNAEFLRRENIVTILNVSREEYWSVDKGITIHSFPLGDSAEENIRKYFSPTYRLLEAARVAYYSFKRLSERSIRATDDRANSTCGNCDGSAHGGCAGVCDDKGDANGSSSNNSSASNAKKEANDSSDESLLRARPPCVLVHCRHGISRSVTIVLAYLMRRNGWSLSDALKYVVCRRPCVEPNIGFMGVLLSFQRDMDAQKQNVQRNLLPIVVRNLPPNTSSSAVHKFFEDRVGCVQKVATFPSRVAARDSDEERPTGTVRASDDEGSSSDSNDEANSGTMCLVVFAVSDSVQLAHRLYHRHPDFFEPLGVTEGRRVKLTSLNKLQRPSRPASGETEGVERREGEPAGGAERRDDVAKKTA